MASLTSIIVIASLALNGAYVGLSLVAAVAPKASKVGKWASKAALDIHNIKINPIP